jgi:VWFA-related protein
MGRIPLQKLFVAVALILLTPSTFGQRVPPKESSAPTIQSSSTLVLVPTLVTAPEGDLVRSLQASDFQLTDNGIDQKVSLENVERQPLSVVVLMQIGGAGSRQFAYYAKLETMLDYMMGSSAHRVALVAFDSQPEFLWDFTSKIEDLNDGFTHPEPGDKGAAIFDAVDYGIGLLKQQPASSRRILILLSQPQDVGSRTHSDEVVQRLGENNITIYSVIFSPEKTWLKDQFTKPRHENPLYQISPNYPLLLHTFDLGTPLGVAIKALQTNAASEIATMSGGESVTFDNQHDLEEQLGVLANHIPSRYALSFKPSREESGFHAIQVRIPTHPELHIAARTIYWSAPKQ